LICGFELSTHLKSFSLYFINKVFIIMGILLAIETSTECASIALLKHDQVFVHELDELKTHSAGLVPAIEQICKESNVGLNELSAIAYGAGPGAFTGLRTACGVVQGLAFGLGITCIPILSLHAMAQHCLIQDQQFDMVCVLDARMNEVYWAHYRFRDGQFENPVQAKLTKLDEALNYVKLNATALVLGRGFENINLEGANIFYAMPHAREIVNLAQIELQGNVSIHPELVQPIYLRNKIAQTTIERASAREQLHKNASA
jgi:tRNA threonylcarbamoyladenosine biosynthesis protein TsaB